MKTRILKDMKTSIFRKAILCLTLVLGSLAALAQEVTVTVTPIQRILPPQVMLYINDPGRYFNIQLINNSQVTQNVYLAMTVEQIHPSSGLHVAVPAKRQPQKPFTIAPGQVRQLTMVELKTMFNHVVKSEVQATPGLFESYTDGTFGLLPEGTYEAHLTAYKWDPALANPVPVSNPVTGKCQFMVCYKAQAPQFILPMATGLALRDMSVAKLSRQNPQFTWREPVLTCNPAAQRYTYDIKVVELYPGQQPDDAMDHNPAIYLQRSIMTPLAMVPKSSLDRMKADKTYLAQVTARTTSGARMLNYVQIENGGKSPWRMFRVVDSEFEKPGKVVKPDKTVKPGKVVTPGQVVTPATPVGGVVANLTGDDDGKEKVDQTPGDDEKKEDDKGGAGGDGEDTEEEEDSLTLYKFKVPTLREPSFEEGMARKSFIEEDIDVEWRRPQFVDGRGARQDTIKFSYTVDLFRSEVGIDMAEDKGNALKGKPIITKSFKNDDDNCTITWEELTAKTIRPGDHLILRVTAKSTNEKSVEFVEGNNTIDFAIAEHLAKTYFQCTDKVQITNTTPTSASDSELKGKTIGIGQYQMKIDEIKKVSGKDYYEGKGHVEWKPMGIKVMIAVKFDSLKINSDNIVYGGNAITYQAEAEKAESNSEVVDKLFSDWGIDNLIGDMNIPYSNEIQQTATDKVKNLAETLDVSKYYQYVKKGKSVWDQFLKGEISDLHLPVALPKSVNPSPVDIQIVSMKFSPASATMNVLGEFAMPESKYYENEVLLLGAPRLCVSPDDLLPESGTLALLGDFTLNDPQSDFDFTFKAPTSVLEPSNGCFVSWHDNKFEMFDVDVVMTVPGLVKVDAAGNRTEEHPKMELHASISEWEDWFAEVKMDNFEPEDLQDWTFMPGDHIVYDHSKYRNADGMKLPVGYDKTKAGLQASDLDAAWQGLYIKKMGVVFPKMLSIKDNDKNWNGRLKLEGDDMYFDASGCSLQFGMNNIFDFETGKVGGWGISMKELKLDILQNSFQKTYFTGDIKTPLEGIVAYRCDIYAQGKNAEGKPDPNRSAYIFKTQQVEGLKFDFWLGDMKFDKDQTYFLIEAEKEKNKDTEVKVELCMGGDMSITIGRDWLKKQGKVGKFVDAKIPGLNIAGMRIANCERWKSHYTQNQYESPKDNGGSSLNDFFGWKSEYNIATDKFYFSLGRWSLSTGGSSKSSAYAPRSSLDDDHLLALNDHGPSPELLEVNEVQADDSNSDAKLGPFDFTLTDFNFDYRAAQKQAVLTVGGKVAVMGGLISAGCTLDVLANVDLQKYDLSFNTVEFKKASFDSEFGGVTLKGSLEASGGDDDGYKGELEFAMPGGFLGFKAQGGYFKRNSSSEKFTWGYFMATVTSSAGLRLDPIVINKIMGGMFFNCKAPKDVKATPTASDAKKGVYGGRLGLGFSTSAGDNMITADMDLTVVYDTKRNKLSSLIMNGTLDALKASKEGKGMVNAKCQLAYVNDTEKYIEINVTASGGASLDQAMQDIMKEFTGSAMEAGKAVTKGLSSLTEDEKEGKSTEAKKTDKKETFKANCGFEVTLNFKVTMNTGSRSKWHLYIGEPPYEKRCRLTLIDFQAGKKSDAFAAWAYLSSNMYLCLGNELPNNGALPDPPQSVLDFLDGKDVNGGNQKKSSEAISAKQAAVDKMTTIINSADITGGLMVGAGAEGDFGVNAGIVYAKGAFAYGFDLVLEHFGDNAKCQGGRKMGYHGWYGMGSAYAMLTGDLGVRIRLWFIKKDVSLISVGLGAMLQAGLPNPTWVYGKVRASCSLLGGIFKFNHAIEFKAGNVCMPDYGNPLDDLKMFASATPGIENDESKGYASPVSPNSDIKFVTNYTMDKQIRLVDENMAQDQIQNKGVNESEARANCERVYKFQLGVLDLYNVDKGTHKTISASTSNHTDYSCFAGALDPNTRYKLTLNGYAKEWDSKNKQWVNPEINGERQEKKDQAVYYFKTGSLEPTINDDIAQCMPNEYGLFETIRYSDAIRPSVALKRHRSDLSNSSKYEIRWELWNADKRLASLPNRVWTGNNNCYEFWEPDGSFSSYLKPGVKGKAYSGSWEGDWGYGYQIKLMRIDRAVANQKFSKVKTKTVKVGKSSESRRNSSQPSLYATSNSSNKMDQFFAEQQKDQENSKSTIDENSNEMLASAKQSGRYELTAIEFNNTVNTDFSTESNLNYEINRYGSNRYAGKSYLGLVDFSNTGAYTSYVPTDESNTLIGGLTTGSNGAYSNLTSKMKTPYHMAAFYSKYLGLGGVNVKDFYLYDYWQNNIKGFSFDFWGGDQRSGQNLDGMLAVNSKSAHLNSAFWRLMPLRTIRNMAFTTSNKNADYYYNTKYCWDDLWQMFPSSNEKRFSGWNYAPDGWTTNGVTANSIVNSVFWRQRFGSLLVGDAITVDMFSAELRAYTQQLYEQWYWHYVYRVQNNLDPNTGQVIYDNKGKQVKFKDKNAKAAVKNTLRCYYNMYRNVVKTQYHGKKNWEYSFNEKGYSYYLGNYELPLNQIILCMWMSGDLGKIRGDKLYGDPTKNFSKGSNPHRFKHWDEAFRTMYYNTADATTMLRSWTSFTFLKFIPDAYNINSGTYSVVVPRHMNTHKFVVNNPFSNLVITRKVKNSITESSLR